MAAGGSIAGGYGDSQRVLEVLGSLFSTVRLAALPKAEQQQILAEASPSVRQLLPLAFASQLLCQIMTGQERASSFDRSVLASTVGLSWTSLWIAHQQ